MGYKISLKAARVNANMLQSDVAETLGVSKESVANWEKGKTAPKSTVLVKLCGLYGVPIDAVYLPVKFDKNEQIEVR